MALLKLLVITLTFCTLIFNLNATICPKGKRVTDNGKSCQACPKGTYHRGENRSKQCEPCGKCHEDTGSRYVERCTKERNRSCRCEKGFAPAERDNSTCRKQCNIGYELKAEECVECQEGYFSSAINSKCQKWTECKATGIKIEGTKTSDAICNTERSRQPVTTAPTSKSVVSLITHFISPRPHEGAQTQKMHTTTNITATTSVATIAKTKGQPVNTSTSGNHTSLIFLILGITGLLILTLVTCKMYLPPYMAKHPVLPSHYMQDFCSEDHQTVCSPCPKDNYSLDFNIFDRCEPCHSCQQEYTEKCSLTRNANCSCRIGFLCSNSICSKCEENKCVTGEKPIMSARSVSKELIEYSYRCEPRCPASEYFNATEEVCKPRTQCRIFGLRERFPGNLSHDAVCNGSIKGPVSTLKPLTERHMTGGDLSHVILGIGFVLVSLSLLVLLIYLMRKHKTSRRPVDIVTIPTNTSELHLSKEESGFQLIIQDESRSSIILSQIQMEKITNPRY
ncbi:uncharacterized protein V6R79_018484 [Siganus canaliculatus]